MLDNSIFQQIATIIAKNPAAPAIKESHRVVSYADLGRLSQSIARQILSQGCPREAPIPVITRGGIDMVAGMIGSLQAATTFVPIDADAPSERNIRMLRDLGSGVAVADNDLACSHLVSPETIVIRPRMDLACHEARALEHSSIIYGFFTSGSTGQPKCCLNTHLGLANRFAFNTSVRPLSPGNSVLQNSKHTFDPVLWQVLWPLTRGAKVIIPRRNGILDIEKTVATICREHVVMTDIVPSVLSVLLDYLERRPGEISQMRSLTELFVGGEEICLQLVRRSMRILPWVRLTNTYGPTEAAIGMIYHHFDGTEAIEVPLGIPIPGTFCHILDERLAPVPDGEFGQLAIGGDCLGAGYFSDPEKTAASFRSLVLPAGQKRVFLTGDRAVRVGGKVYFKGRTDKQIKIRGVRVELKEIETTYEAHTKIHQFRVMPVKSGSGEIRLHAFFTAHSDLDASALTDFGRARLPAEFIPSTFQRLASFKTTSSGKIDRAALRDLVTGDGGGDRHSVPRATAVQALVRKYIGQDVKPNTNLFDLGLDSLSAMRLAMEIEGISGRALSASQIYSNPTIASIQALADGTDGDSPLGGEAKPDLSRWGRISVRTIAPRPKVLLTGATGYLGIHLLDVLSNRSGTDVYCLVRAPSEAKAMLRLHQCALRQGLHEQTNWEAVHIVLGDLSQADLGISRPDCARIFPSLTAIYNSGAEVNFMKPLSRLESVNVLAVRKLAEYAMSAGCHLHHISSTAAVAAEGQNLDTPPAAPYAIPPGGYAQSKLAAEIMLDAFAREGLTVTVYRVGELMPSPRHPTPNFRSTVIAYLRTICELKVAFLGEDSLDYCPVDAAARVIGGGDLVVGNFYGVANQERVSHDLIVSGLNRAGAEIRVRERSDVHEMIGTAARLPGAADHLTMTWAAIKAEAPDGHWPILSSTINLPVRSGGHRDWPMIDEQYLANALCTLVPTLLVGTASSGGYK